ncbi:DinB family protein [Flavobacterium psychrotrophum]|uniref:DinB family protein n=1 Tax=Flavobacterium psychrotrophum TaxID=2294119 RepID=UPI000E3195C0|nr:DinB family protein [Flavobacterium psychrotrophum]
MENVQAPTAALLTSEALLKHWQGHRGLTRRTIEAFPEKDLFEFSIGGMRTFAVLAMEIVDLTGPGIKGLATGEWSENPMAHISGEGMPKTKEELLTIWDETTNRLETYWPQISTEKFDDAVKAFGMYDGTILSTILYFMDNEVHHRGQGYVYLRALGIEPPFFWERA